MITTSRSRIDTPKIGAPPAHRLAGSLGSRAVRSKGDRTQVNTRQPRVLAKAAEAEAARRGVDMTTFVGEALAAALGMDYAEALAEALNPNVDQEVLPLAKSA